MTDFTDQDIIQTILEKTGIIENKSFLIEIIEDCIDQIENDENTELLEIYKLYC